VERHSGHHRGVRARRDHAGCTGLRVYYTENVPNPTPGFNATATTALVSVRLDGTDKRTHAKITTSQGGAISAVVSPDARNVLVLDRDDLYAFPLADVGTDGLVVNFASPALPPGA
jgi:hypothetical protein